jgi:hypothetical protein
LCGGASEQGVVVDIRKCDTSHSLPTDTCGMCSGPEQVGTAAASDVHIPCPLIDAAGTVSTVRCCKVTARGGNGAGTIGNGCM